MAQTTLTFRDHINATAWWIAASLVEDGRDPDWVRMVMREKGHGEIDLDQARAWLNGGGTRCLCADCERGHARQVMAFKGVTKRPVPAAVPAQMSLF